jgi:peroxiredoxin
MIAALDVPERLDRVSVPRRCQRDRGSSARTCGTDVKRTRRKRHNWLLIISLCIYPALDADASSDVRPSKPAPAWELPLIDGGGYLRSIDVFPNHRFTYLIFWDSGCPHCVEALVDCDEFCAAHEEHGIAVVGIHADIGDMFEAQRIIEQTGIAFPQTWDVGGETSQAYGVSFATFTVFVVNSSGRIVAERSDPKGAVMAVLEDMLVAVTATTGEAAGPAGVDVDSARTDEPTPFRFVFRGDARIRFLSIDSRGRLASGLYGEAVQPGDNLLYRFELEISRRITRRVRVGGLLRISNEGKAVLESGPKYLGVEWGSAFAEADAGGAKMRIGYYSIWMTPLTLMRWDWNDNPRVGGTAGCGCGAAAGVLLIESLEVLGPEIVFEGGIASYRIGGFETRLFYGIPRRATDTSYLAYRSSGQDRAQYSLETGGFETSWRRVDERTESFWRVGVRAIATWEDHRSADFRDLGYPVTDPWYRSTIVSADARLPLFRHVDLEAEWVAWNRTEQHGLLTADAPDPLKTEANGGLAGVVFEHPSRWRFRCDYLRLDPAYFAPFAALSYKPNRSGVRLSGQGLFAHEVVALSLFYKRLEEREAPETDSEKLKESVLGASIDLEFPAGIGGNVGWMDESSWRAGDVDRYDGFRKALIVGARWRVGRAGLLEFQYQKVDVESRFATYTEDALTHLYSVYFSASF